MFRSIKCFAPLVIAFWIAGCATVSIDEVPMYGRAEHSPEIDRINREFIKNVVRTFGSKEKASDEAAKQGWKEFYQGDLKAAIKRFNQCWLLNTNNAQAYWGLGVAVGQEARRSDAERKLRQSITFLEQANEKSPKNARIKTDLAYSHTMLGAAVLKRQHRPGTETEFEKAQSLFDDAMVIDATYPLLHYNWSVLNFYRLDYVGAKERLDKAVSLGCTPEPKYLEDLNSRLKK